jgi:transposase-like protein
MPRRPPNPAVVASVLADAKLDGDESAARKHGVSLRTVERWRREVAARSGGIAAGKRQAVVDEIWEVAAARVQLALLARVEVLAAASDDLRQVAGALKIVSDAQLATQVVNPHGRSGDRAGMAEQGRSSEEVDSAERPIGGVH